MRVQWMGGPNDGEWVDIADGLWSLRVAMPPQSTAYHGVDTTSFGPDVMEYPIRRFVGRGGEMPRFVIDYSQGRLG